MRKTSIVVVLSALLFVGCSNDSSEINNNKNTELEYTTLNTETNYIGYVGFSEVNPILQNIENIIESNYDENEKTLLIQSELTPFTEIGRTVINHINNNYIITDVALMVRDFANCMNHLK